jgi:(S)-mandelate dehydrogenase
MTITKAINFDDLRRAAKRHLPKIAFDFIEGGVDAEEGIARNEEMFKPRRLVPRYGIDVRTIDASVPLFGQRFSQPWGIAPTGAAGLFRNGSDIMLARAAKSANVPFILSGMGCASIEDLAEIAPEHTWFQLYMAKDRSISWDMVARAKAAGFSTLVITVDIPGHGKRERNLRNGFAAARPLRPALKAQAETLLHPSWLAGYLRGPALTASHWQRYAPEGAVGQEVLAFVATQIPAPVTWDDIAHLRKIWPRNLVVKGVMHPADAVRCANLGVDGVLVSNHGGRQMDRAPAPIEVLPAIHEAVGDRITLLFDSGIRRGADIVTALASGAKFCFVGRWTLYGVAAGAEAGAAHAVDMINSEVRTVMTQMGAPDIATLGPEFLMWDDGAYGRNARG